MHTRHRGWQLGLLWILVLAGYAVALRQSTLVPWGSGAGPGRLGAPIWALMPLTGVLAITAWLTIVWWRRRDEPSFASHERSADQS